MKVTGIAGAAYPSSKGVNIGTYVTHNSQKPERALSRHECPYCHGPMSFILNCAGRVIWQNDRVEEDGTRDIIVDPAPSSHLILNCQTCMATFSISKVDGL